MASSTRGEADWTSPETLVITILVIILGMALLYYLYTLRGRLLP